MGCPGFELSIRHEKLTTKAMVITVILNVTNARTFFLSFFLSLFASYRSLQNDNGHVKEDITVKLTTWNLKDLTRIPL
jgi:hypothetical protein